MDKYEEFLSKRKTERIRTSRIVETVCSNVIIDAPDENPPIKSVCRFYLKNGLFIGELPAEDIITACNAANQDIVGVKLDALNKND